LPSSLEDQIINSFSSISRVIKHALADSEPNLQNGWDKVFRVTSYHVDLKGTDKEAKELMVKEMKTWCPNHCPVWTLVGVERLALEAMKVEIEVSAYAG
jgi:enamine deaminase RidA (YjgF/YER057c/UK114 family)